MSGLIKFKFGFENSLKFGFEKFEKEKEKGNFPLRAETFLQPNARPAAAAHLSRASARFRILWAEPKPRPAGPLRARAAFFRTEPLTSRSRLSASPSPFLLLPVADDTGPHVRSSPSSSHRRFLSKISPIRIDLPNLPLSFFSGSPGL
jgi:hypothetical protein